MEGEGYGVKHSKRGKDGSSELIMKKLMKRYNFFLGIYGATWPLGRWNCI